MKLFKVQNSISFIAFDYPDPLMSEIFKYKYKSQGTHWVNSMERSGEKFEFLSKLGYKLPKLPVLENSEKNAISYMINNLNREKGRKLRFPVPNDYNDLVPHLSSLNQILKRINPGKKFAVPGRIRIRYKIIRRGLTKIDKL